MKYPALEEEKAILSRFEHDFKANIRHSVEKILTKDDFFACRDVIEKVFVQPELLNYMATIVHSTRHHSDLFLGASPRASLALMKASKAIAAMSGRNFVTPDDVRLVSYPVLNHRVILTAEYEMEGYTTKDVIEDIIKTVEVPR